MGSDVRNIKLSEGRGVCILIKSSIEHANQPSCFGTDHVNVRGPGEISTNPEAKVFKLCNSVEWKTVKIDWGWEVTCPFA